MNKNKCLCGYEGDFFYCEIGQSTSVGYSTTVTTDLVLRRDGFYPVRVYLIACPECLVTRCIPVDEEQ